MATQRTIELNRAMHQVATQLMEIDWLDQEAAKKISPMADAIIDIFTVLYYQAETGLASKEIFLEAQNTLRQAIPMPCSS